MLTHLHNDHMGWAVPADSPFVNARVLAGRADVETYTANRDVAGQYDVLIEPLLRQDRLQLVDGDTDLGGGLRIVATPGHTPGQKKVLVDDQLLITGDLLVHAIQMIDPDLAYVSDTDPELARETRCRMLARHLLGVSHLGTAFHRYP